MVRQPRTTRRGVALCVFALLVALIPATATAQQLNAASADELITANGDSVAYNLGGVESASLTITGTFTGTLSFRVATRGTTCTTSLTVYPYDSGSGVTTATAPGVFKVQNEGASQVCVTATAWSSGTAVLTAQRGYGLAAPPVSVDLSGASLNATVSAPADAPLFTRLSNGSVAVDTLPVSVASLPSHAVTNAGTFATQSAQSGTWTVQPGNTANTTAWLVTGAGGTFPISGLPTAATTSAVAVRCVTAAGSAFESCAGAGGGGGGLTDTELRASAVPVSDGSGSLTVDAPATTPVFMRLSNGTTAVDTIPISVASIPSHAVTNGGTFATQAAQSGTWTVQPGNTANTTAWLVTGAGGSFPVTDSGGSLTVDAPATTPVFVRLSSGSAAVDTIPISVASIPTHAVTESGTWTVQPGNTANTTAWLIAGGKTNNNAAPGATNIGALTGVATAVAPTYTEGNMAGISMDLAGNVRTLIPTGAATSANQTTELGYIDGLETLIGTSNTNLSLIAGMVNSLGATTLGSKGVQSLCAATTTAPTYTTDLSYALSCTLGGALRVALANGLTDATHGGTISTTGPQVMFEAASGLSGNTAVSDGQPVRGAADIMGRQIQIVGCDRADRIRGTVTITDGSSTSVIAASGSGIYSEVWDVTITNTSSTAVTLDLRDGTAGSVMWTFPVPPNTFGVTHSFSVPPTTSTNTAIAADPSAAASGITVSISGCKAK